MKLKQLMDFEMDKNKRVPYRSKAVKARLALILMFLLMIRQEPPILLLRKSQHLLQQAVLSAIILKWTAILRRIKILPYQQVPILRLPPWKRRRAKPSKRGIC